MKFAAKAATLFLLTAFVTGCQHKAKITPPAAAQAPIAPASTLAKNEPAPELPPAELPTVTPAPKSTPPPPPPKPQKEHHKPKHTTIEANPEPTPAATAPSQNQTNTEQAANGAGPTNASPIGELAVPGEATNVPRRDHINIEIDSTEKSLNNLKRQLNKDEQTTAAQIRTYIAKSRDAMKQEDLDGANILITKAKVLLDELINP